MNPHKPQITHPLLHAKMARMGEPGCHPQEARRLLREIGLFLGYEATRHIDAKAFQVSAHAELGAHELVIAPILRAGLPLAEGLQDVFSSALIAHLGFYRQKTKNAKGFEIVEYIATIPETKNRTFIITDYSMSSGDTASHAIYTLKSLGVLEEKIVFISLIASEEGENKIMSNYPGVRFFYVEKAPNKQYRQSVLFGPGKVGDKLFGTT